MTVGEMRRIMLGKVVPESVVPQNIVDFLIDENAELPEPDAFTFLNRLRGLGIGSADFLYLLEGCGAPQEAVDKIKANPAMNLQGLILTLESSGMTSKDYTRILYTARQIWERTLTLRLETSERISGGEYPDDNATDEAYAEYEEPSFEKVMDITMTDLKIPNTVKSSVNSNFSETAAMPSVSAAADENPNIPDPYSGATEELMSVDFDNYDFDNTNTVSLEATVDFGRVAADESVSGDGIPEVGGYANREKSMPEIDSPRESNTVFAESEPVSGYTSEIHKQSEPFEVHIASYDEPFNEPADIYDNEHGSFTNDRTSEIGYAQDEHIIDSDDIVAVSPDDFHEKRRERFEVKINYDDDEPAAVPRQPNIQNRTAPQQYNGETTMIVPIDQTALRENLAGLGNGADKPDDRYDRNYDRAGTAELPKTARQLPKKKRELDDNDYNYEREESKRTRGATSKIHKGAVITAAVGAAALIGVNVALGVYLNSQKAKPITYAKTADAVFTEIYYAHADNVSGGDMISEYQTDYSKVFGNLLICGSGLGTFTSGNSVYSVSDSKITASVFQDGELTSLGRFEPADGTKFVAAFEADNSLIAVYSGNECGYLKIQGEQTVYTVRQSGELTDFKIENGEVKIGSVYTPRFYETFNAEMTDVYLPKAGVNADIITPQNIILSNTKGYSYAISASYSLNAGAVNSAKAAIGNPVYASADGEFVMNGSETKRNVTTEYGLLINANASSDDGAAVTKRCEKVGCAASFAGGCAVYEDGGIVLRGRNFENPVKLGNLAKTPTKLRFSDNVLIAADEDGIFFAADCSNINEPKPLKLTQASGNCDNNAAITLEARSDGVKLTRYVLENGTAKEISTFTRELSADQARTLVCGTANAMITRPDCCGAAYSYFDGVSVISEYVTLSDASEAATLFDDKTGFEYAFVMDGKIYAVCSKGAVDVTQKPEVEDQPGVE